MVLFDNFIVRGFTVRYLFFVQYTSVFFCAIFDRHIRMKTKQIRKKKIFMAYPVWGDAELSIWGGQISMGDASYRWEDVSPLQFKYWLYFHSQVKTLLHYYDTATVRNQHQLLTCKISKWLSLLF